MAKKITLNPHTQKEEKKNLSSNPIKYSKLWILLGLIVGVGIIGIIGNMTWLTYKEMKHKKQEEKANQELEEVEHFIEKEQYEKALMGEEGISLGLKAISEQYSTTKAGNLANFYIGIIYIEQKKYKDAIPYLKNFKTEEPIQACSLALIADAYSNQTQYNQAAEYYEKAAKHQHNQVFTPSYLIKASQVYEKQKKYKKALNCYQKIIDEFPSCTEYKYAKKHAGRLEVLIKYA